MNPIIITLILFILSVIIHILFHKLLLMFGIKTFKGVIVFIPLLIILIIICTLFPDPIVDKIDFRLTAYFLYILMVLSYILMISSPILGDESSSSKIINLLKVKSFSEYELNHFFSNKILIKKRIDDLIKSNLIILNKNIYYCTNKGKFIAWFFKVYRSLMGWNECG
jgi:hypothetical protein